MSQHNIEVVRGIYDAFLRGDTPHIVAQLGEKFTWINPGSAEVPYAGIRHTPAGVADFFAKLAASVDVIGFEAQNYMSNDDQVAVTGYFEARAKSTRKQFRYEWAMWWRLSGGKVVEYRSYPDTQAEAAGFVKSAAA